MSFKLRVLGPAELVWSMSNTSAPELPYYRCGAGQYQRSLSVDPYPGYPHDAGLVTEVLAKCEEAFPLLGCRTELCLLGHEFIGRSNGLAFEDQIYDRADGTKWEDKILCYCGCGKMLDFRGQGQAIVLCAKRIPPMPAMTRYLVAHEYGHTAFNLARRLLGYSDGEDSRLEATYMKIRGYDVPSVSKHEGGRWHQLTSEIVANDFRTIVMKTECEFWPHEVPQMTQESPIAEWWRTVHTKIKEANTPAQ